AMEDTVAPVATHPFADLNIADIVARLNEEAVESAAALIAELPIERAVDVLDRTELKNGGEILLELPGRLAGRILKGMSADRAADTLRQLD
ncbi:hypothetical protein MXD81_21060, partial [Microbacteriaceae bacterium K1510]|nr:hypothetical protein [Microbacteriaceae bacterium K1510]